VTVEVQPAGFADKPLIEGLFQFYAYDFSELEPAGSKDFAFNADGRFEPYPYMDAYWSEPDRWPLLIRVGGETAGFALINTHSHRGGVVERNMGEFWVARKHRRGGVGAEALRQILALHPGRWEVAVAERNTPAQAFWPRAIAAAPNVTGTERMEGDGEHWTGPIWTFQAVPSPLRGGV
jgi:predicted acetyltransferase